ncbi:hypothetical protein GEMRC1_006729 [Eukaryota sp. GEM-RC1]
MTLSFDLLCDPEVDLFTLTHHASEDTKVRAVWTYLWLEKTQAEVSSYYAINQSTLSRWVRQAFKPKESHLRDISILDDHDRDFILTTLEETPELYLREIVELLLHQRHKSVSVSTIHRFLIHSGYSWKRCQILVKRAKRSLIVAFENRLLMTIGPIRQHRLLFVDEITFRAGDFERTSIWSPKGAPVHKLMSTQVSHPISACVAIDINGYVMAHIQEGHFNRSQFVSFLTSLNSHGILYTFGGPRSCIVLDGCNIHNHDNIIHGMRKAGVAYHILPPYCPDSNPIETFFQSFVKLSVQIEDNTVSCVLLRIYT